MPKKKKTAKKKAPAKKKAVKPKKAAKVKKSARAKKPVAKKSMAARKPAAKKAAAPKKAAPKKAARGERSRSLGGLNEAAPMNPGPGFGSAGQSGDTEGLSDIESADSESVEELAEEGQDYEAELVAGVENAPDPDEAEVSTEVPEDDIDPEPGSFSKRRRI